MDASKRHDVWNDGTSYEAYMGRWSRRIAVQFVHWLDRPAALDWLEVGCGSGALTAAILSDGDPATLESIDSSEGFVETTRRNCTDSRLTVKCGDGEQLDVDDACKDVVVSGLVLNFIENRSKALAEMRRVARPDGTVGFYVWDYPGAGVEFMRHFWSAAIACDPEAGRFTEGSRFSFCTEVGLLELADGASLTRLRSTTIEVESLFASFDDFWHPFTLGVGPAPGYCASLSDDHRDRLRQTLVEQLPIQADGSIPLKLRAWAIAGQPG